MKRILSLAFLAMVAADPSATGTEGMSATGAAAALTPAVTLIDNAITATKTASAKEKKLCKEETDATILWDKTVNTPEARAEAKGNREARMAAKKELAGALANRLKVLQAFLEKLYKARQRLGGHIHRVNDMFQTVYGANTQTQINAAEAIKLLGISVSQPHSPMFKPIKLPKHEQEADAAEAASLDQDKDADPVAVAPEAAPEAAADTDSTTETVDPVTAEASETIDASTADAKDEADAQENAVLDAEPASENAPADEKDEQLADATELADASASSTDDADAATPVSAASLMELEASINGCAGEDCNQAYTAAFALYKTTYLVNKENVQHFENERKALGGFRDGLKALIKKKEDKMAALAAQLKELMNAMANPGPTLESLFKMIKQHYDVTKTSCALMDGRSKTMLQLLSDPNNEGFLELIKAGKVDCQGETAPVDTSAADAAAKDAAAASEATDDAGGSGVDTTAVVAPVAEIEDVVPEKVKVPEVKDDTQVSNTKIPEPPLGGVNTEIVNIDTKPDLDSGGKEIFDAQV